MIFTAYIFWYIMFGCVLFYLEMYHEYFLMLKILHFIDSVIISIVWLYHDLFPRSAFLFVVRYNKIISWWGILPIHRSNRCSKWERERNATGKLGWIRNGGKVKAGSVIKRGWYCSLNTDRSRNRIENPEIAPRALEIRDKMKVNWGKRLFNKWCWHT